MVSVVDAAISLEQVGDAMHTHSVCACAAQAHSTVTAITTFTIIFRKRQRTFVQYCSSWHGGNWIVWLFAVYLL